MCDLVYMSAGAGRRSQSSPPRLAADVPYTSTGMTCSFVLAMTGESIIVLNNLALSNEPVHSFYC